MAEEYERRLKRNDEKTHGTTKHLQAQIRKTQRTISRLIDAYEDGLLSKEEFEPRIRNSKERLAKLETDAAAIAEEQAKREELRVVIGQLKEFSDRLIEYYSIALSVEFEHPLDGLVAVTLWYEPKGRIVKLRFKDWGDKSSKHFLRNPISDHGYS